MRRVWSSSKYSRFAAARLVHFIIMSYSPHSCTFNNPDYFMRPVILHIIQYKIRRNIHFNITQDRILFPRGVASTEARARFDSWQDPCIIKSISKYKLVIYALKSYNLNSREKIPAQVRILLLDDTTDTGMHQCKRTCYWVLEVLVCIAIWTTTSKSLSVWW